MNEMQVHNFNNPYNSLYIKVLNLQVSRYRCIQTSIVSVTNEDIKILLYIAKRLWELLKSELTYLLTY